MKAATTLPERMPLWANAAKERDWLIKDALAIAGWYESVDARIEKGDCHLWTGHISRAGYGRVYVPRARFAAFTHRVVYLATHGDIPTGHVIDHRCNVRACCRPEHLEAVTQRENNGRADRPSWYAVNAAKTQCLRGHPLSGDNLLESDKKRGWRSCRACTSIRTRERNELLAEAAAHLGMSQRAYIQRFGRAAEDARLILDGKPPRLDLA
jgi:hypothetical protein